MRLAHPVLLLSLAASISVPAQRAVVAPNTFPATGVDFAAIDAFYTVADLLRAGTEPSAEQWSAMLATPGYRLLWQQNRSIRQQMLVALAPSRHATRDSILATRSDASLGIRHLIRAVEQRDAILTARHALEASIADSIARGVAAAARFLPPGTVDRIPPPFIAFAVFGDDGYSLDGGILLDPVFVAEHGLVPIISHEFHHAFLATVDRRIHPAGAPPADVTIAAALMALRTEGIADQIDKPHPLPPTSGPLAFYVSHYNELYANTPAILASIDSLLGVVHDDSTAAGAAGIMARKLLWSNSHPNGAYMAREIVETFGIDSLMPGVYNPFAFLRTYASAEAKHGRPPPFSPRAIAVLDAMERRYIRPAS